VQAELMQFCCTSQFHHDWVQMARLLVGSDFLTVGGIHVAKFCSVSLFVASSNHEMVFYVAWNTLPINPQ